MDQIETRLAACFQTVFPQLERSQITTTSQAELPSWDSVAAIMLLNVVEDEFQVRVDLDLLSELDSFERILEYVKKEIKNS